MLLRVRDGRTCSTSIHSSSLFIFRSSHPFAMSYDQVPSETHQFMYASVPLTSSFHAPANVLALSQPDEDDLEALSFSHPNPSPTPSGPSSSQQQHQPSYAAGPSNPSGVSGKIGQDGPNSKPRAATSTIGWGGVRVETRYTGESTLDEPVSKTIVCIFFIQIILFV